MSSNDTLMHDLLTAKKDGQKILYSMEGVLLWELVEENHAWDLCSNEYEIHRRKEFIVRLSDNDIPEVVQTENTWTRSDFGGTSCGGEYILMREVYPEEM